MHRFKLWLKSALIAALSMLLFACAGDAVRTEPGARSDVTNFAQIRVRSDVVSDFERAISLLQAGKNLESISLLKTVIEREQRLPAPFINIAIAYNRIDEADKAETHLLKAIALDAENAVANNELGLMYRKAGKFAEARQAYEQAIKAHPSYLPAKRNLGVLCDLYLHDQQCAAAQFEAYLKHSPDDKTVKIWLAEVKRRR